MAAKRSVCGRPRFMAGWGSRHGSRLRQTKACARPFFTLQGVVENNSCHLSRKRRHSKLCERTETRVSGQSDSHWQTSTVNPIKTRSFHEHEICRRRCGLCSLCRYVCNRAAESPAAAGAGCAEG